MDIIGTRFSTIPGDFEQGLLEIILKKLIQNGQKRLNVDTLITLINVQLKLEKIQLSLPGSKNWKPCSREAPPPPLSHKAKHTHQNVQENSTYFGKSALSIGEYYI